jgi:sugar/nucleoside kinase (ribokinase family)
LPTYDIYGLGAALVDTEITVSDEDLQRFGVQKGVMTLVDEARQHELLRHLEGHLCHASRASGGSAANSIIAAQYLGAKTFYSCKVADDDNGHFYLADLANAGVAYPEHLGTSDGITGKCLVMITDDAERTMNTFLGISATLSVDEIDEEALKASKYVYIEGYLVTSPTGRPAAIRLRELAQQHGAKTAVSLSDPAIVEYFYDDLRTMVGNSVDLLFCNSIEALRFTQTDTLSAASEQLRKVARTFAITLGAEGAEIFDGEKQFRIPAPAVVAVDTNGAGDMFAGAFLYALSRGQDYATAGALAVRAAAQVVSQFGPRLRPEQHRPLLDG